MSAIRARKRGRAAVVEDELALTDIASNLPVAAAPADLSDAALATEEVGPRLQITEGIPSIDELLAQFSPSGRGLLAGPSSEPAAHDLSEILRSLGVEVSEGPVRMAGGSDSVMPAPGNQVPSDTVTGSPATKSSERSGEQAEASPCLDAEQLSEPPAASASASQAQTRQPAVVSGLETGVEPRDGNLYQLFPVEPTRFTMDDVNQILVWGAQNKVSDTFIYAGHPVKAQKAGRLIRLTRRRLEFDEVQDLLAAIKPNADAQIINGQDVNARHDFTPGRGLRYAFRVNAVGCQGAAVGGRSIEIVLRTIPFDIPSIATLGVERHILDAAFPPDGLVLVTGQTGSGKSTLLASLLQYKLQNGDERILTYEDPIEFPLVNVPDQAGMIRQCEVGRDVESFADGIRNALRCKPDIILIGEARDRITIEMTIRAAETGHTVYSTVHTRNVINTIDRMSDEFPTDARWAVKVKLIDAMRLIVHQRLLKSPNGGRTALREYLVFTEELRERLIQGGAEEFSRNMIEVMAKHGRRLVDDAEEKYAQGLISKRDYTVITASRGL